MKLSNYLKSGLLLFGLLLAAQSVFAQRTITGTLTDGESGDPLIGAYILVTGTQTGAVTDYDGKYSLELPAGATTISVSYTGFGDQTIEVGSLSVIDVVMQPGSQLEEVVVIGYGTVKREDATGSVETVSAKEFNQGAITSAQELVSGKVAGVQITTDGSPGGGAQIRIRGGSSLYASNDPLIVIDGVPIESNNADGSRNPLNLVNPNDIETFTVLKDASATAIYGSRASNGVVLITTKKGAAGSDLKLSYNGSVGVSTAANTLDVMSGDEYRALIIERFGEGSSELDLLGDTNTDWQDEVLQNALFHNHNVSATGAFKSLPYRASVGYTNQNGVLKTDEFQRITYGFNLTPGFLENTLQLNFGVKGVNTQNHFADRGALGAALAFDPTRPVFADNNFGGYNFIAQTNGDPETLAPANPLALLEQKDDESSVNRYIANFSADYRMPFLPELRANLNLAYDKTDGEGTIMVPATAAFAFDGGSAGGSDNSYTSERKNELLEFYLNYAKDFKGLRLDVLGGYSWQNFFFDDTFLNQQLDGSDPAEGTEPQEYYLLSLFGRANINIGERLLLTGTLRRDGSSRFSEENRYGLFPSAAAAYKLIDNVNNAKGLNNLKLRVGYGVTGQQDIGQNYYPSTATYVSSFVNARYPFGDRFITTLRPGGYNSGLKWEESATVNLAVDFGFFNDRLNGSVEVYSRKTTDLLNFTPIPAGTNLTNFVFANIGDLEGQGFEISLNGTPYRTKNSSLEVAVNFSVQNNEITRLAATDDPNYRIAAGVISGGVGNQIQTQSVGFAPFTFYVYEQVYDESGTPIEGVYVDRNGDGVVSTADLYEYKNRQPQSFFGMTINYNVGNFDLSTAGRASFGNYMYNNNLSSRASYGNLINSNGFATNTLTNIREVDFEQARFFSDHFVQNASFFRLDHITAGYRFDDVVGVGSSIRTYLTVQNPLLITDYEGVDPEKDTGIDNDIYPRARTILLGVGVNF